MGKKSREKRERSGSVGPGGLNFVAWRKRSINLVYDDDGPAFAKHLDVAKQSWSQLLVEETYINTAQNNNAMGLIALTVLARATDCFKVILAPQLLVDANKASIALINIKTYAKQLPKDMVAAVDDLIVYAARHAPEGSELRRFFDADPTGVFREDWGKAKALVLSEKEDALFTDGLRDGKPEEEIVRTI